jgi:hypothetical protein
MLSATNISAFLARRLRGAQILGCAQHDTSLARRCGQPNCAGQAGPVVRDWNHNLELDYRLTGLSIGQSAPTKGQPVEKGGEAV